MQQSPPYRALQLHIASLSSSFQPYFFFMRHYTMIQTFVLRRLVVRVGLGVVLLEEREELLGALSRVLGRSGSSLGRRGADGGLLGVKLGELSGEVGGQCRGLGRGRRGVVSDGSGGSVLGLVFGRRGFEVA